jgi:hypothetical protein
LSRESFHYRLPRFNLKPKPFLIKKNYLNLANTDVREFDEDSALSHNEDHNVEWTELQGPIVSFDEMDNIFDLDELGVSLMVGNSSFCSGKGVFISLLDRSFSEARFYQGSMLCGYSRGEFGSTIQGDKSVGYLLTNLNSSVIYDKEFQDLSDIVRDEFGGNLTPTITKAENFSNFIAGHRLYAGSSPDELLIFPSEENHIRNYSYFIPHPVTEMKEVSIRNVGMYANDLAFNQSDPAMDETSYLARSNQNNSLMMIWRMEKVNGRLIPTWPIVLFKKNIIVRNHEPIEIGMEYSWGYWSAVWFVEAHNKTEEKESYFSPFSRFRKILQQ